MPSDSDTNTSRTAPSGGVRLDFLDGIRGLAALYVAFYHAWQLSFLAYDGGPLPLWFRATTVFKFGDVPVSIFIVLSGFCLMLPVTRTRDLTLPRGFWDYLGRRARRLLPPYYVALAGALLIIMLSPTVRLGLSPSSDPAHALYDPSTAREALVAHLFLVHNLAHDWATRFDPPLWSVATEWQIYLVFPLVLLPIFRRFGGVAAIGAGLLAGALGHWAGLRDAAYGYVGVFAMGMVASVLARSPEGGTLPVVPWKGLAAVGVPLALLEQFGGPATRVPRLFSFFVTGAVLLVLLVTLSRDARAPGGPGIVTRLLSSRPLLWLGALSYSLYLVHYPLQLAVMGLAMPLRPSPPLAYAVWLIAGVPALLAFTYVFHRFFERPFLNEPRRDAPVPLELESVAGE